MRNVLEFESTAAIHMVLDDNLKTVYWEMWLHLNDPTTLRRAVKFGNMSLKMSYNDIFRLVNADTMQCYLRQTFESFRPRFEACL
jgi:hypothetical protein